MKFQVFERAETILHLDDNYSERRKIIPNLFRGPSTNADEDENLSMSQFHCSDRSS